MMLSGNEAKTNITTPRGNIATLSIRVGSDGTCVQVGSGGTCIENHSGIRSDMSLVDQTVMEYDDLRTNISHLNPIEDEDEDEDED